MLLEARDALARWGFAVPPRHQVHALVRLRCNYATDPDLKTIGAVLDSLSRLRNQADYDWTTPGPFTDGSRVDQAIRKAEAALVLLDQIDADPQRRAQAVAAIRRAFP